MAASEQAILSLDEFALYYAYALFSFNFTSLSLFNTTTYSARMI
jgi:hypothetical protein